MMTIWLWVSCGVLALIVLGLIPGVKDLVRPIVSLITNALTELFKLSGGYVVWVVKMILTAHLDLARHLIYPRSKFKPQEEAEDNASA